jgi:phosphopentomutase
MISELEAELGVKFIGNKVASGTAIINELGEEHIKTGCPIVYTSADSVFQIATHEAVIPLDRLYSYCRTLRKILPVGRVIARPFIGEHNGSFTRTGNRRDFSLEPTSTTILDVISSAGLCVSAVGKIEDIFCKRGITQSVHTTNNLDGIKQTIEYIKTAPDGLIFTNLVDTDMLYGHRNDVIGYANALKQFDDSLPSITAAMSEDDVLFITADHGCDPTTPSTDHSREYVPLLAYGSRVKAGNIGIRKTYADLGKTVLDYLKVDGAIHGEAIDIF